MEEFIAYPGTGSCPPRVRWDLDVGPISNSHSELALCATAKQQSVDGGEVLIHLAPQFKLPGIFAGHSM